MCKQDKENNMDKKEILKRLKSKVVWVAVISQILLIVILIKPEIANEVKIIAMAIIEILSLFGFLNNPSNKEGF